METKQRSIRIVSGVLAGVAAAMATIAVVEAVNGLIFPLPAIDWSDAEAVRRVMLVAPFAAQAVVVAGWLLGAMIGAGLAVAVGRRAWAGWFPAGSVVMGGIFNALLIDHPWWMDLSAVVAPLVGGALGIAVARRRAS